MQPNFDTFVRRPRIRYEGTLEWLTREREFQKTVGRLGYYREPSTFSGGIVSREEADQTSQFAISRYSVLISSE